MDAKVQAVLDAYHARMRDEEKMREGGQGNGQGPRGPEWRDRSLLAVGPETGRLIGGLRSEDGKALRGTVAALLAGETRGAPRSGESTAIGVVATNVALTKSEASRVAAMAHDGFSRSIRPVYPGQFSGCSRVSVMRKSKSPSSRR